MKKLVFITLKSIYLSTILSTGISVASAMSINDLRKIDFNDKISYKSQKQEIDINFNQDINIKVASLPAYYLLFSTGKNNSSNTTNNQTYIKRQPPIGYRPYIPEDKGDNPDYELNSELTEAINKAKEQQENYIPKSIEVNEELTNILKKRKP